MPTDVEADRAALAIYVVMSRDAIDALDMIAECTSIRTLETLLSMLTTKGKTSTDQELNALMVDPTKRRLAKLKEPP